MAVNGRQDWAALNDSVPAIDRYALRIPASSSKPQMILYMSNAEVWAMMRLL